MLAFVAEWATPCQPMLAALDSLAASGDRNRTAFVVVFLDADGSVPAAGQNLMGLPGDGPTAAERLGIELIPTVMVLSPAGAEVARIAGHAPGVVERIAAVLDSVIAGGS